MAARLSTDFAQVVITDEAGCQDCRRRPVVLEPGGDTRGWVEWSQLCTPHYAARIKRGNWPHDLYVRGGSAPDLTRS